MYARMLTALATAIVIGATTARAADDGRVDEARLIMSQLVEDNAVLADLGEEEIYLSDNQGVEVFDLFLLDLTGDRAVDVGIVPNFERDIVEGAEWSINDYTPLFNTAYTGVKVIDYEEGIRAYRLYVGPRLASVVEIIRDDFFDEGNDDDGGNRAMSQPPKRRRQMICDYFWSVCSNESGSETTANRLHACDSYMERCSDSGAPRTTTGTPLAPAMEPIADTDSNLINNGYLVLVSSPLRCAVAQLICTEGESLPTEVRLQSCDYAFTCEE